MSYDPSCPDCRETRPGCGYHRGYEGRGIGDGEIRALFLERDRLRSDLRLTELDAQRLHAALQRFGVHLTGCPQTAERRKLAQDTGTVAGPCDCGLAAELEPRS